MASKENVAMNGVTMRGEQAIPQQPLISDEQYAEMERKQKEFNYDGFVEYKRAEN